MLKLFYSGASSFNNPQGLSSNSIGGFISNTSIPNGTLNSLFTSVSVSDFFKSKKVSECIGLGLFAFFFEEEEKLDKLNLEFLLSLGENDDEDIVNLLKDAFEFQIGIGPISGNNSEGYYIESITAGSKPFYLSKDFQKLKFDEKLNIEDIPTKCGLWINRTFNPKKTKELFNLNSKYWEEHNLLPNLDFELNLKINLI